jgi:hypothetical protein
MRYFILLILCFSFFSCSIFKNKNKNNNVQTAQSVIDSVNFNNNQYKTLTFRFVSVYSDNSNKYTLYGKTEIIKDSILFIDLSLGFGISVANIYALKDTIILYFPIQNNYISGNKEVLLNQFGIAFDFYSLQSILTSQLFPYPYFYKINDYILTQDSLIHLSNIILNKSNNHITDVVHIFNINNDYTIHNFFIFDYILNKELYINYNTFIQIDKNIISDNFNLKFITNDTLLLDFKYKKIEYNKSLNIIFNLPDDAKAIHY